MLMTRALMVIVGILTLLPIPVIADTSDGETVQVLAVRDRYPDWSPDGDHIVFDSNRSGIAQIYRVRLDDGQLTRLTHGGHLDRTPVFGPDGARIAFASTRDGAQAIYIMGADGDDPRKLTDPPQATDGGGPTFNDSHPRWAPDGRSIIFNRDVDADDVEIFEIGVDGTGLRRLTRLPDWDTYPSISPDGRHILWRRVTPEGGRSPSGRNSEIFVAERDGSDPRNISNHPDFDGYPSWLPGGEGVVFASNRGGDSRHDFNIYAARPDGSGLTRLTDTIPGVSQVRPIVAPDGRRLLFNRDHDNGSENEVTWLYVKTFERPIAELLRRTPGAPAAAGTDQRSAGASVDGGQGCGDWRPAPCDLGGVACVSCIW